MTEIIIYRLIYETYDEVVEWLRRWTANPLGSGRVGSNPILVVYILFALEHNDHKYQLEDVPNDRSAPIYSIVLIYGNAFQTS